MLEYPAGVKQAEDYSKQIFDTYKENPKFLYLQGLLFICAQGNMDRGRQFLTQCLKRDPDMAPAQKALKKVRKSENLKVAAGEDFKSGKFADAIDKYSECLTLFPTNAHYNCTIYLNRSMAQQKMGENHKALDDLTKAIELNENYNKAYVKRAEIHAKLEQYQECVYDLEAAKKIDPVGFGVQQKL